MRADFVNPFLVAATQVLETETKAKVSKGTIRLDQSPLVSSGLTVVIGVTGIPQGIVLYDMTERSAKSIVSAMVGEPVAVIDPMTESAVAEIGNVITGLASVDLEKAGFSCRLSPPGLVTGRGSVISTLEITRLVIPLRSDKWDITIHVALREF